MKAYLAQIAITLKLTFRDRMALFFNYFFPLVFFFIFGELNHAGQGGVIVQVVTMVLTIGVLGNGFFGAGIRSVQERELNILRRFKVAPITAAPMLVSSLLTGLCTFLPSACLVILLAHVMYHMPFPARPFSLLLFLSLGLLAFRSIGLIIAAVVNSMQESQILIQLLYFPMLFLSGATIPLSVLPPGVRVISQFLPATYLITGLQSILGRNESIAMNVWPALALILTTVLATFIGIKLFRWEKEEKVGAAAKVWVLAVLAPFLLLGAWQAHSHENDAKAKMLERDLYRSRSRLIQNVRIFVGNGQVIESGAVLIRNGKIAEVFSGAPPDPKTLNADPIDAAGKTLLPGLIDVHVHLGVAGTLAPPAQDQKGDPVARRLAAYLYSGITAVKSVGDAMDVGLKERALMNSGQRQGAELFLCGPMFTTAGGHGTEYFKDIPEPYGKQLREQALRLPTSAAEAHQQVAALKKDGMDGIKAILEAGQASRLFNRMDVQILRAISDEAHAQNLPIVVHTGGAKDVSDAIDIHANGIEHGSFSDAIPDADFARMKAQNIAYDPTLTVVDAFHSLANGGSEPLDRPLVQQVIPAKELQTLRAFLASPGGAKMRKSFADYGINLDLAKQNLLRAWKSGVMVVTGSDAGNPLVFHGPTIHRELQLWVEAGIPPAAALQAATGNAARLLRMENRIGTIQKGREANLLLVDGNPLLDIKQTENIQLIIYKGERIDRPSLFDQE